MVTGPLEVTDWRKFQEYGLTHGTLIGVQYR
jgi:hypothetical protein